MVAVWSPESLEEVADRCRAFQTRPGGRIVGLVNGCFDVLHPGHVLFLREAGEHCNALVVAIDGDEQVVLAKGASRPLRPWPERAFMVAAVRGVFAVVQLDRHQPLEMVLAAIHPDLYMFRAGGPIEELQAARRLGLGMLELPRHGAWSTTRELARWQKRAP